MQATLQQMHDGLVKDLKSTRDAIKRDAEEPVEAPKQDEPKVEAPKDMQPKEEVGGDMTEGTPAWITGDIEAPQGEKDMGGWTMRAYTKEQQERLNVDEEGKALPAKGQVLIPVENTRESSVPTALSAQSTWLEKAQLQLRALQEGTADRPSLALGTASDVEDARFKALRAQLLERERQLELKDQHISRLLNVLRQHRSIFVEDDPNGTPHAGDRGVAALPSHVHAAAAS